MAEVILYFILMIPVIGILIWTFFHPEESILFRQRWIYKDEPEFSELAIRYTKFSSIVVVYLILMIFVFQLVTNFLIRFFILFGFILYFIIGGLRLLKQYVDS
ncbi:hypothetical protein [Bacillus nitroreducens]